MFKVHGCQLGVPTVAIGPLEVPGASWYQVYCLVVRIMVSLSHVCLSVWGMCREGVGRGSFAFWLAQVIIN